MTLQIFKVEDPKETQKSKYLGNETLIFHQIKNQALFYGKNSLSRITCKKIPCYICATQLAGGLLLKKLKYLEVMLNIFEFSRV